MIKHEYAPDTTTADRTDGPPVECVVCGLPMANRVHEVDGEMAAHVSLVDARKLGEGRGS